MKCSPSTIDLATYRPKGDKHNTPFFEEHLPRVYERRARSGLNQLVGTMAAVVIQVDHGHGLPYLAADPAWPRMIVREPLTTTYEDEVTRWNAMYPLSAERPNARYIGEVYHCSSTAEVRQVLEAQNIHFVYPEETANPFYALHHLTFSFLSDYTYIRVGYVDVSLDSLAALD